MESENIYTPINFGFVPPIIESDHYVLGGAVSLPTVILQPDRQWDAFLPDYEPQFGDGWDTYGCSIWGTENATEILDYRVNGEKKNYAERPVYIGTHTRPPGNDPHVIAEWIRKNGLVDEYVLPMTPTFEEFITPDPLPDTIIVAGGLWAKRSNFGHEWVFLNNVSKEEKKTRMMESLQYSPLGVSVTAWYEEGGIYVDQGFPNTHWCTCYGFTDRGWKIFDSYDHSQKIYSFDSEISFCKRYTIGNRATVPTAKPCWLSNLFNCHGAKGYNK